MRPEDYWINRGADVIGAEAWDEGAATNQAPVFEKVAELLTQFKVKSVLDVGCNIGNLTQFWDGDYLGVDINPFAVEVALAHGVSAVVGDLRALDFEDKSFDVVVVKNVIEHLESFVLEAAYRVAKRYVIVVSCIPWTDGETVIAQTPSGYYLNSYSRDDMRIDAEGWGFQLLPETYTVASRGGVPNGIYVFKRQRVRR